MNGLPLRHGEQIATFGRMNACQVQDFRGIQVANSCDGPLIEEGNFDCPSALCQPLAKPVRRKSKRIGPKFSLAKLLCELPRREQSHGTQPATVPIPDVRDGAIRKVQPEAKMLSRWRIGDEDQPRHARLED